MTLGILYSHTVSASSDIKGRNSCIVIVARESLRQQDGASEVLEHAKFATGTGIVRYLAKLGMLRPYVTVSKRAVC